MCIYPLLTMLVPKALNNIVPLFSSKSRRMPIVLGTFTSSSTKFVAYESASAIDCQECTTKLINMLLVAN